MMYLELVRSRFTGPPGESKPDAHPSGQFTSVSAGARHRPSGGQIGLNPADLSNISGIGGGFDLGGLPI